MTNTTDRSPAAASPSSSVAKDAAAEVATTAKEQAGAVAETSKEELKTVARDAKEQARDVLGQSREQLRGQANEQARRLSETLTDVSRQLSGMARGESAPQGLVADVTNQLASSAEQLGQRLQTGGLEGALDDVKRFARQRPGVFLAAALGSGIVVGRLLRSVDTHALLEAAKPGTDDAQARGDVDLTRREEY
jgi:hypothetical protein